MNLISRLIVRMVSKARPLMDIYAFTKDPDMVHSLNILWGVRTLNLLLQKSQIEEQSVEAIQFAVSKSLLSKTDHVIIVSNSGHYHQTVSGIDPLMGCTVFIIDLQKLFKDETEYE